MIPYRYVAVGWRHNHSDEPICLYSELDAAGWEKRKVEQFKEGRYQYADATTNVGSTRLGDAPVPSIAEIAKDPQFTPKEITKAAFEAVWAEAKRP
jgi:hypothetical protein